MKNKRRKKITNKIIAAYKNGKYEMVSGFLFKDKNEAINIGKINKNIYLFKFLLIIDF